ncbi:MAG: type III pantothenate kinase [Candidatus Omnitrophica bacterium]|nr:type III pantothenate kinase [Candidatus Omnitrophota bacterium]
MILTVDIGNTTIALGVMRKGKALRLERVETVTPLRLLRVLRVFKNSGYAFDVAVICSVVPEVTVIVERIIRKYTNIEVKVVGRDIVVPIKNCYKNPRQVGQDRLVGAYAALHLYGKPAIVIDLGTAITFDAVSGKGEYWGGVIVPGLRLSAESLFLKTALLPEIALKAPKGVIGKTTEQSILSGLFYGYGSLCRGMIELMGRQMRMKPKVVMTGGHTRLMKKFIAPQIRSIDDHLVHKGMALLVGKPNL